MSIRGVDPKVTWKRHKDDFGATFELSSGHVGYFWATLRLPRCFGVDPLSNLFWDVSSVSKLFGFREEVLGSKANHSETSRIRFQRAQFRALSSLSFLLRDLSELLSVFCFCAKANSPSFRRTQRVWHRTQWVRSFETELSKHYSTCFPTTHIPLKEELGVARFHLQLQESLCNVFWGFKVVHVLLAEA